MILYHERRATKDGSKRVEVQVEEVTTTKGPRYVVFTSLAPALSQNELKQEWLFSERERAVRASLEWFDRRSRRSLPMCQQNKSFHEARKSGCL